jgi:nucleoside-triphosphatase
MPNNLFLIGESGVGKSTALAQAAEFLAPRAISGLLSPRLTDGELNSGWRIEGFNGVSGLVVHSSIESTRRMGSFGVDIDLFERCVEAESGALADADLVIIDEIGLFGDWSNSFREFVTSALDAEVPVVAIVRRKRGEFSDEVKLRSDAESLLVTQDRRDSLPGDIARWVEAFDD